MAIFDAHLHIIDPRFPLVANQGYLPAPFSTADYRRLTAAMELVGGAVVAGSFQGFDQTWLEAALGELGTGFVGVAQLPVDTNESQIEHLDTVGVRALRINLRRGRVDLPAMTRLAERCHARVGWHTEVYLEGEQLADLQPWLLRLPAVVIDHVGVTATARRYLPLLAEHGVGIKASGFGRLDFDPAPVLAAVHRANPRSLLFGTDLPGTRAPRSFTDADLELISRSVGGDGDAVRAVLCDNARQRYLARDRLPQV